MKKDTRTIEQTIYIAEDGTIFLDEVNCAVYEQKNPYNELIKDYPHIKNILFFNQTIDGFYCENQEQIDNCCNWLITNYKINGKRIITTGRFIEPDYYFFINHNSPIDDDNNIGTYIMMPLEALKLHWQTFLMQLPKTNNNYLNNIEDVDTNNTLTNNDKELLQITWINEFLRNESIHNQFQDFIQLKIDTILKETQKTENLNIENS